jgi:hypothetical protein
VLEPRQLSDGAIDRIPTATAVNGSLEDVSEVGVPLCRIMVSQLPSETSPEALKEKVLVTSIADNWSQPASPWVYPDAGLPPTALGWQLHKQPFTEYRIIQILVRNEQMIAGEILFQCI